MNQAAANPLLDEIDTLQDQVLAELDQLNRQIESVLKVHLAAEANGEASIEEKIDGPAGAIIRHDVPMVIQPPFLHPTLFLPTRMAS